MKNKLLIALFLLLSFNTMAHNPQVSNISITQDVATNKSSLLINVPLLTCENELHNSYPSIKIDSLSKTEFQQLLLHHFKKNIQFIANKNDTLMVSNGLLSIGHETQFIFELSGMPQHVNALHLNYSALSSQYEHFAILQISLAGKSAENFIFNNENNYALSLINQNNKFQLLQKQSSFYKPAYLISGIAGVVFLLIGFLFFHRRKKVSLISSFNLKQ